MISKAALSEDDRYQLVAEFIMDVASRLDKDPNDIVIGIEAIPSDKHSKVYIDIYDMEFNILERH